MSPTIKIGDIPRPCSDPSHFPPSHMVWPPGIYEHTCPGCGNKMQFTTHGTYCYRPLIGDGFHQVPISRADEGCAAR